MNKSNLPANPFVIGSRPFHTHHLPDGTEIQCNSAYCDEMNAHPLDQPGQRLPWSNVPRA